MKETTMKRPPLIKQGFARDLLPMRESLERRRQARKDSTIRRDYLRYLRSLPHADCDPWVWNQIKKLEAPADRAIECAAWPTMQ
jgi:hypothetical protein